MPTNNQPSLKNTTLTNNQRHQQTTEPNWSDHKKPVTNQRAAVPRSGWHGGCSWWLPRPVFTARTRSTLTSYLFNMWMSSGLLLPSHIFGASNYVGFHDALDLHGTASNRVNLPYDKIAAVCLTLRYCEDDAVLELRTISTLFIVRIRHLRIKRAPGNMRHKLSFILCSQHCWGLQCHR